MNFINLLSFIKVVYCSLGIHSIIIISKIINLNNMINLINGLIFRKVVDLIKGLSFTKMNILHQIDDVPQGDRYHLLIAWLSSRWWISLKWWICVTKLTMFRISSWLSTYQGVEFHKVYHQMNELLNSIDVQEGAELIQLRDFILVMNLIDLMSYTYVIISYEL